MFIAPKKRKYDGNDFEPTTSDKSTPISSKYCFQQRDVLNNQLPQNGIGKIQDNAFKSFKMAPERQEDVCFAQTHPSTNANSFADDRFLSIYYTKHNSEDVYSVPSSYFDDGYCSHHSYLESERASGQTLGNGIVFENPIGLINERENVASSQNQGNYGRSNVVRDTSRCSTVIGDNRRPSHYDLPPAPPLPPRNEDDENEESPYVSNIILQNTSPIEKPSNPCAGKRIVVFGVLLGFVVCVAVAAPLAIKFQETKLQQINERTISSTTETTTAETTTAAPTPSTSVPMSSSPAERISSSNTERTTAETTTAAPAPSTSEPASSSPAERISSSPAETTTAETTSLSTTEPTTTTSNISGTFDCHSCTCSSSRCPVDGNMKYTKECGQVTTKCRIACFSEVRTYTRLTHRGCVDGELDWEQHKDWRGRDSGCHQLSGGYVCFCRGHFCNNHDLTSHQNNPDSNCIQTRTTEPHNCS